VIEEPRRRGVLLHLILTEEWLVAEMMVTGSLDFSAHEMVESRIQKARRRVKIKFMTLDVRRAYFGLFKDLLRKIPQSEDLEGSGAQERWLIFNHHTFQAQEGCIPPNMMSGENIRRPMWMNK